MFIRGGGNGVGRESSSRLAAEGADIAIFNRKLAPEVIGELRDAARRADQRFETNSADVSDASAIRETVGSTVAETGTPNLAIDSAGIQIAKPFAELAAHEFDRVLAVSSIMPAVVGGNTIAPKIMIGDKGADAIRADWR